ncbi:MAG TPA: molybdopterin cofactor-binding domain-containing protein [Verrucomicrobiae bacterium]|nr:molybdopterin cofactor-binding domain-containing protein [Verrucomicrobiae bacterium]
MNPISNVSRRGFLRGALAASAFVLCARYQPATLFADELPHDTHADDATLNPNVFVGVDTDGTVWIIASRSEMGTTSRTSLPLILADELDADWSRVKIQQAIGDARYGDQDTDGSHSIRSFYQIMRECGATARYMLIQAAAQQWAVPASECSTEPGVVVHKPSGRRLDYGQLAAAAAKLPVPAKSELKLKTPAEWRYIGKGAPSYDLEALCTGKAVYGYDTHLEGMVYASVEHPPVLGGKVKSFDDKEALKVQGVRQTIAIEPYTPPPAFQPLGGVAVIADNTWAAFQGRQALKIEWDNGANATYNSDQYKTELRSTAHKPGVVMRSEGDVDAVFSKGGNIVERDYYVPLLAHASMEPPAALAHYQDGKVYVWTCTQNPQGTQETVAKELGIAKEDVICHVTLLGGGFGRKSKPDYVAEAAILSKKVGRPVKVLWSREDDIKFDYYNAVAAMYMKASVGQGGKPMAWLQRSVFPPIASTFALDAVYGGPGSMQQGWTDIPYEFPNLRVENGAASPHVRIGWLRSVANIYHAFAVQSFTDELAHLAGRDAVDYLLELIGPPRRVDLSKVQYPNYGGSIEDYPVDTGRLRHVVELVAEKSGWAKFQAGKGRGIGIAAHRSFLTYVATVVEVEADDKGAIRIPRVETVVDAGLVTNPEATKAQFEGAAVFGASIVRSGEITATNGAVDQGNFDDYPVARMAEAPFQTNVTIVESMAPPAGAGEPGVPAFVPAFCNAIFAATGKRVRDLPLSDNSPQA